MTPHLAADEELRRQRFPVCREHIFLAHAAVTAIPRAVADAMATYVAQCSASQQEFAAVLESFRKTRALAGRLLGCGDDEIALLGPTALGLSLFAEGLEWAEGDEVICYAEDYPANVYPWIALRRRGVRVCYLQPERPGEITPELVESALGPRTRLVALASAHFLTGYRIDLAGIGRVAHARGALFSLDAIQTLGAFPTKVEEVDFLSSDAHKWLLGPLGAGVVMVKREHFGRLRPVLVGAWNVRCPNFIAQDEIEWVPGAQRYEPGTLNAVGIAGLKAAMELLLAEGIDRVAAHILALKRHLAGHLETLGFRLVGPVDGPRASGILTCQHESADAGTLFAALGKGGVVCSLRHDRAGQRYLRFSPHVYNTPAEMDRVAEILASSV